MIYANLQPICKQNGLPLQRKNKKIWHTNIITIIITMKTKRHARAACISTNIITITTTNMMKKGIIITTTMKKGTITTIMTKAD